MKSLAVLTLAAVVAPSALSQPQTVSINPLASAVNMTLKTTHELVKGTFHVQSGSIEFDRGTTRMTGLVVILAGSGKTGNENRDKRMNNDILKVDQYTTVTFVPKAYTGKIVTAGDSTIQVTGIFSLLGAPHEITVPVLLHFDGSKATATARFVIPYVQWGLKNPSFLIWKADDNVAIDLLLSGQLSK